MRALLTPHWLGQWTDVEKGATTLQNLAIGTTSYSFVQEYTGSLFTGANAEYRSAAGWLII